MSKIISIVILIIGLIAIVGGIAFVPEEIMEANGPLIILGSFVLFIVLIGVVVAINAKSSQTKHEVHETHNLTPKPVPKKEIKKDEKQSGAPPKGSPRARHQKDSKGSKKDENEEKSSKDYESEREVVEDELKEAEKKYLKHKIDKKTYDSISQEAHHKLIELEASIDMLKKKDLSEVKGRKLQYVSNDKKNVLEKLLNEKKSKVYQSRLAEKKYLKRKIDEKTYRKIKSDIDKEIISISSKIKSLHKANEIEKIKSELKSSLAEVEKQKNISSKRITEELEEDIIEQIPWLK